MRFAEDLLPHLIVVGLLALHGLTVDDGLVLAGSDDIIGTMDGAALLLDDASVSVLTNEGARGVAASSECINARREDESADGSD